MTSASASGKIILFGEHAVVYGRPALAIPIPQIRVTARISVLEEGHPGQIYLRAPDIGLEGWLKALPPEHPLARAISLSLAKLADGDFPPFQLEITSTIPLASGMGSSAAVSISIARALKQHLALPLSTEQISSLAYEVEKLHHGTPSGIDNSVISYEQPVSFLRGREPKLLELGAPMDLIIGDTGVASPTSLAVRKVRQGWEQDRRYFESLFDQIAHLTRSAERALVIGDIPSLGPLMNHNQVLLEALGVSSPELARLILGAREAGALGAKLSGAGMGGNMIALVTKADASEIQKAILASGAIGTIPVRVGP